MKTDKFETLTIEQMEEVLAQRKQLLAVRTRGGDCRPLIAFVAEKLGVTIEQILSRRKDPKVTPAQDARTLAMALAYKYAGVNLEKIAEVFARNNHSTIAHACSRVRRTPRLQGQYRDLAYAWEKSIRQAESSRSD